MSHYFISRITIHDPQEYSKYLENTEEVFSRFNGKYLVVDDSPLLLEGTWSCTRTVVIEFESKSDFELWYRSPEYQEILKFRLNAAECSTVLVKGLESSVNNK